MSRDDPFQALREALQISPENVPLRKHLADLHVRHGNLEEAEVEYKLALKHAAQDHSISHALADVYFRQKKYSHALVIVESLLGGSDALPSLHVLHARLLLVTGEVQRACSQYQLAVQLDPQVTDLQLERALGMGASVEPDAEPWTESDSAPGLGLPWDSEPNEPQFELQRPLVDFSDVGGMEELKEQIRLRIIHPLNNASIYQAYGKPIGGGILMYGPPGCGKTLVARATAGEIDADFLSVGINDILDMWMGNSERNLHDVFQSARRSKPCVLFFDEVDALGASRSDMRQSAGRHLINQFLAEMDGVNSSNDGVLIMGATNAPWHLDAAFRRPGRFDRILFVPPPDLMARVEILKVLCQGKPTSKLDLQQLAKKTAAYSGADLKNVVDLAIEAKLKTALRTGTPEPIQTRDLLDAIKQAKPTTKEWFSTARNYALYSNVGGIYDDILEYLKQQ
ncbi:MAG: AAA family ATPase [Pirellulaceae bacterium]